MGLQDRFVESAVIRRFTIPIGIDGAKALVSGRTEKPGGVDPIRFIQAGAGNGKIYRHGDVPLSLFIDNQEDIRYDGTVDMNRAADYASRSSSMAPPVIATQGRKDGMLRIHDGGHRITAARLRGDKAINAIVTIELGFEIT